MLLQMQSEVKLEFYIFQQGKVFNAEDFAPFVGFFGNISQERLTGDETADYSCYK